MELSHTHAEFSPQQKSHLPQIGFECSRLSIVKLTEKKQS
jgi:hypothetical protein